MPTQKEIREFQRNKESMLCVACNRVSWRTYSEIMESDKFFCQHCDKPVEFDKAQWRIKVFKAPRKSLEEKINEKGRSEVEKKKGH